jgi:hypothetical protein
LILTSHLLDHIATARAAQNRRGVVFTGNNVPGRAEFFALPGRTVNDELSLAILLPIVERYRKGKSG